MKTKLFQFKIKNLIFASICGFFALVLSLISNVWSPFYNVDNKLSDTMFQHKSQAAKEIYLIGIDDETVSNTNYGKYQAINYRDYFADILNFWSDEGIKPSVIGFDIIFNDAAGCEEVDAKLGDAMSKHNVVLGVNGMSRTEAPYSLSEAIYNGSTRIGYVDAITDSDEAVRRTYLKGKNYNSLAYTIYDLYCTNKGITPNDYKSLTPYHFDYYAKPELNYTGDGKIQSVMSGFQYMSFGDLMEDMKAGQRPGFRNPDNTIVLFGSYVNGESSGLSNDLYNSPIGEMFGVEVQCNIIQSLLNDKLYIEMPNYTSAIINTVVIFGIVLLMTCLAFYLGIGAFVLGIGLEFIIMLIAHGSKAYYFITLPVFILIVAFVILIILHYYNEYKHKKEIVGTFKRYISPDVAEALVEKEADAMSLGGRKRDVSCLFVDIRGFTKMSEELDASEVVDVLNGYLEMATKQVFRFNGMVDKFIGDCVMAIFNAPVDLDDYVFKSVCAAYAIVKEGKEICDYVKEKYDKKLEFGVGVHCGTAVIGNIGSKTRMDFTAIGDTVNTASRIEASAGGNQVLISKDVYELVKDRVEVIDAGDRMFKNKKEPITCYEVVNIKDYEKLIRGEA